MSPYADTPRVNLEPVRCECCGHCWRVKGRSDCVYNGPYFYMDLRDKEKDE